MASANDDGSLECGYCMEKLPDMTDPRHLECSHVACLPCLEADSQGKEWIVCPHCKETCPSKNLSAMKKVETTSTVNSTDKGPCDVCEKKKLNSAVFCVDCQQRFCTTHQKKHDSFFKEFQSATHEMVSMAQYSTELKTYTRDRCAEHKGEVVNYVCSDCWEMFCLQCDIATECGEDGHHQLLKLKDFADEQRKEKSKELSDLSEKIDEQSKEEKNALIDSEQFMEETERLLVRVEKTAESQVVTIRSQAEEMKKEIQTQELQNLRVVEDFVTSSVKKCLDIKSEKTAGLREIRESTDGEFLRKRKSTGSPPVSVTPYSKAPRISVSESLHENHHKLALSLSAATPDALTDKCRIANFGNASCWTQDGKLVICDREGLLSASRDDQHMISGTNTYCGISIARCRSGYVLVDAVNVPGTWQEKFIIRLLHADFTTKKVIGDEFTSTPSISVSTEQVIGKIMILESTTLRIYNIEGHLLSTTQLPASRISHSFSISAVPAPSPSSAFGGFPAVTTPQPFAFGTNNLPSPGNFQTTPTFCSKSKLPIIPSFYLYAISGDAVILCDQSADRVTRYDNLLSPKQIWCRAVQSPVAVSSDAMGYLYVARRSTLHITVLSCSKGENLQELKLSPRSWTIFDVSVHGNELAVCCKNRGVHLCRIQRKPAASQLDDD